MEATKTASNFYFQAGAVQRIQEDTALIGEAIFSTEECRMLILQESRVGWAWIYTAEAIEVTQHASVTKVLIPSPKAEIFYFVQRPGELVNTTLYQPLRFVLAGEATVWVARKDR